MAPFFFPVGMLFQEGPQTVQIDEKLTVRAEHVNFNRDRITFDSGVVAAYGVTTVYGDHLEVFATRSGEGITVRRAIAKGNVRMLDPEGEVHANQIEFDWIEETGIASSAKLTVAEFEVSAETIHIRKDEMKLLGVSVSICSGEGTGLGFRELSVNRQGIGIGRDIRLAIAGKTLLTLPHYRFTFRDDGRVGGLSSPEVSLKGRYLRASWSPEIKLSDRMLLDVSVAAMQGREASGKVYLTQSLLSRNEPFRGPRPGGTEPYSYGFMENIATKSLEREHEFVRRPRTSISVGTAWNQGRYSDESGRISKPFEAVLEASGPFGNWGFFGQARYQKIDVPGLSAVKRWELLGSVSPPILDLTPSVGIFGRADFRSEFQPGEDYAWIRGQAGISYRLGSTSTISIAYSRVADRGVSLLEFDRPDKMESAHLRGDFMLGPTKLSGLFKFEPGISKPYSTELFVSQIAGCLEIFGLWRDTPRTFTIGFKLRSLERIADAGDRISKRTRGNNLREP